MILWHNCHRPSPIIFYFTFSSVHWRGIQDVECERHDIPLPVRCMAKPFTVSTNYFVFILQRTTFYFCLSTTYPQRPPLLLIPDFVFHLTQFNYNDKGVRVVSTCHLNNIIPDSIFNDWLRQEITYPFFLFNKRGGSTVSCELEEQVQFYHISINDLKVIFIP